MSQNRPLIAIPPSNLCEAGVAGEVSRAYTVLPCATVADLNDTVEFFTSLGFKVERIFPADNPRVVELLGHASRLRLERNNAAAPLPAVAHSPPIVTDASSASLSVVSQGGARAISRLRLLLRHLPPGVVATSGAFGSNCGELVAPNGTVVELAVEKDQSMALPELQSELVICKGGAWTTGRAGMRYLDLLPGRLGGRFIASLIHIPTGGPVPDYVHFHRVRFQLIYVVKGWVRVVYEDQGQAFVMESGDCVLQPPQIRHRVLESSSDLYVVEVGCPAEHDTMADHDLELPTASHKPMRDFGGQRFCRHRATESMWKPWRTPGSECRDTGIEAATNGLLGVRVLRQGKSDAKIQEPSARCSVHNGELLFCCVLAGKVDLRFHTSSPALEITTSTTGHRSSSASVEESLEAFEAFSVPSGMPYELDASADAEWLEVTLPGELQIVEA
eukprot:TRINITY_DN22200_c0_g1_i1.p1 TRINITY_DN22200_c0_g1~~TRINITY_DN22200_c0_g1_i1.p1  ORF type:complete len:446 (-),score=78.79 TRINITY_DN22200_c0_g1_i1:98-1435(-)